MDNAKLTKVFILVVATIAIGLDIYWAGWGGTGATISEVTRAYSWRWATIPLAYGVLTGHLFWTAIGEVRWKLARVLCLAPIGIASIVLDILDWYDMMPIIPLILGVPLGRLCWPQSLPEGQALFAWKGPGKK